MQIPTNLTSHLIGKHFTLSRELQTGFRRGQEDLIEASRACSLETNGTVTLQPGGRGLWIPYREMKATYGIVNAYDWAVSGPFSGCELAVGRRGTDIFVAHIARESKRHEAVTAFEDWNADEISYRARIRLRVDTFYGCYVFVSTTEVPELVRMDVYTSMGGTDGRIFNITRIDPERAAAPAAARASSPAPTCRCIIL